MPVIDLQSLVDTSQSSPGVVNLSSRRPLGVAGLISPWNLPLYLLTFKVAPAIMAGNTVVCKPRCRHCVGTTQCAVVTK